MYAYIYTYLFLAKAKTDSDSNFDLYTKKIKEMELHHKSFDAFQNKHADSYEKVCVFLHT